MGRKLRINSLKDIAGWPKALRDAITPHLDDQEPEKAKGVPYQGMSKAESYHERLIAVKIAAAAGDLEAVRRLVKDI